MALGYGQNSVGVREHYIRTLDLQIGGRGDNSRPVDLNVAAVVERKAEPHRPIFGCVVNEGDKAFTFSVEESDNVVTESFAEPIGTIEFTGNVADGDTIVLNDGTNPAVTFEFDSNNSVVESATLRKVVIVSDQPLAYGNRRMTLANFIAKVNEKAATGLLFIDGEDITVQNSLGSLPNPKALLTHRLTGTGGNVAIVETGANITATGMAGGKNPITIRSYVAAAANVTTITVQPRAIVMFNIEATTKRFLRFKAVPTDASGANPGGSSRPMGNIQLAFWYGALELYDASDAFQYPQLP